MTQTSRGTLYIVSAPSGAGKTSLVSALLEKDKKICVSISHTTRGKRPGEEHGTNYYFVDQIEFQRIVSENGFLEHAEVFGNYYGTSKAAVEEQLEQGLDVILEIDWQGAQQIRELYENTISIFILPPSLNELEKRLNNRGQDDQSVIDQRMAEAKSEISHYQEFDFLIINDQFEEALESLASVFRSSRQQTAKQIEAHSEMIKALI